MHRACKIDPARWAGMRNKKNHFVRSQFSVRVCLYVQSWTVPLIRALNPLVPRVKNIKIRQFNFKLTFTGLIFKGNSRFDTLYCELQGLMG